MPDAAASEFACPAPRTRRVPRALRRRLASYWGRLRGFQVGPTAETAFDALVRDLVVAQRRLRDGLRVPCALTLGRATATAARFGQIELAASWSQHLLATQRADGSFVDPSGQPSRFHTAQAIRGLLALHALANERQRWLCDTPFRRWLGSGALTEAIDRSASYLARQFDASGLPVLGTSSPGSIDRWGPRSLALSWLPPLFGAARVLSQPSWEHLTRQSLQRQVNAVDVTRWNGPMQWWAYSVEALAELAEHDLARAALRHPAACQKKSGAVPAMPGERWTSGAGLALLATIWRKLGSLGECARADRALTALSRQQKAGGGFPASWGREARSDGHAGCPLTTALYLEAAHHQAQRTFTSGADEFPAEIDAADGRLAAVLQWSDTVGAAPRIIDVGCGKGRFLRHLQGRLPEATLVGVDLSPQALARLPGGVTGRAGDLLRIPASDGEFDAAICIEALEHAILPARAVREICRVVRPGGGVLIIDKNREHQALSDHRPWERWFLPEEVAQWLKSCGDDVAVRPVVHGGHGAPTGLFWCWTAKRRHAIEGHRHAA